MIPVWLFAVGVLVAAVGGGVAGYLFGWWRGAVHGVRVAGARWSRVVRRLLENRRMRR